MDEEDVVLTKEHFLNNLMRGHTLRRLNVKIESAPVTPDDQTRPLRNNERANALSIAMQQIVGKLGGESVDGNKEALEIDLRPTDAMRIGEILKYLETTTEIRIIPGSGQKVIPNITVSFPCSEHAGDRLCITADSRQNIPAAHKRVLFIKDNNNWILTFEKQVEHKWVQEQTIKDATTPLADIVYALNDKVLDRRTSTS